MPTGTITISSYVANPPQQVDVNSLLEVRGWYSRDFISTDGVTPVFQNSTDGEQGPYYSTTPTLNPSGDIVVPAHDVQITVGANPTANYFEGLWVDGAFVMLLMPNTQGAAGWQIPSVYGDPIAYDEIATYNRARRLVYPPATYFTADQVIQEIERLSGNFDYAAVGVNGITSMSVAPVLASLPIAVGDNDPRIGSYINIISQGAATTNTAAQNTVAIGLAKTAAGALGGGIYIPAGTFPVNTITIDVPIQFAPGASILRPATGQTVTITKAITADTSQHFSNATNGLGTVSFAGNAYLGIVWGTWWGASGAGLVDAAPAINAAIVAMPAIGGVVELPTGVYGILADIKVRANVIFLGQGYQGTEIQALTGFAGTGDVMVQNWPQDGTQQQVAIGGFWINGNSIAGAKYGVVIKGVGQVSWVRDITINSCARVGLVFDGGPPASSAGYFGQNIAVNNSGEQNIAIEGPIQSVWLSSITSQGQGAGFASILISDSSLIEGRQSIQLQGVHMEMFGANSVGIDINNFNNVLVQGVNYIGATPATGNLIKIRGTSTNVTIQAIRSQALLNLIDDETVTPAIVKDVASNGGQYGYYSTSDAQMANVAVNTTLTVGSSTLNDASGLVLNQTGADGFVSAGGTNGDLYVSPANGTKSVRLATGTTAIANLLVGTGTTLTQIKAYTSSLTPAAVNANTSAEQDFTVTGVTTADKVILNGPAPLAGTGIVNVRVKSANTVSITWGNFTAGSLTPTAGTYNIIAIRN